MTVDGKHPPHPPAVERIVHYQTSVKGYACECRVWNKVSLIRSIQLERKVIDQSAMVDSSLLLIATYLKEAHKHMCPVHSRTLGVALSGHWQRFMARWSHGWNSEYGHNRVPCSFYIPIIIRTKFQYVPQGKLPNIVVLIAQAQIKRAHFWAWERIGDFRVAEGTNRC